MKHGDIVFGTVGTVTTGTLTFVSASLAVAAGVLTVGVMFIRFRREWKHRNDPPKE